MFLALHFKIGIPGWPETHDPACLPSARDYRPALSYPIPPCLLVCLLLNSLTKISQVKASEPATPFIHYLPSTLKAPGLHRRGLKTPLLVYKLNDVHGLLALLTVCFYVVRQTCSKQHHGPT